MMLIQGAGRPPGGGAHAILQEAVLAAPYSPATQWQSTMAEIKRAEAGNGDDGRHPPLDHAFASSSTDAISSCMRSGRGAAVPRPPGVYAVRLSVKERRYPGALALALFGESSP